MSSSFIFLLIAIFLFIYLNCVDANLIWKNLDEIYCCIEKYYRDPCKKDLWSFPSSTVLKYFPCQGGALCNKTKPPCDPPLDPPKKDAKPKCMINVNCGQQQASSSCCPPKHKKKSCIDYCIRNKEVILGRYKYEIDKLSGIINKYEIDGCREIIEETREIMYHSLGTLNKIYINAGKIIVEDSYSVEHTATIDVNTGILNF